MNAIGAIYDAVSDDETFANLAATLAETVEARSGVLQFFSSDWRLVEANASYFSAESFENYVARELYRHDVWRAIGERPGNRNRVLAMDQDVPPERFVGTLFFEENFRRWGDDTGRCIGGVFEVEGGYVTAGFHRALRAPAFTADDAARLAPIMSHFRRMGELRRKLAAAEQRAKLSEAALDAQPNAAFILDATGAPVLMNRAGDELARGGDGLKLARGGLRATEEQAATRLADAIAQACSRTGAQGGAIQLPTQSGRALRAVAAPVSIAGRTFALLVVEPPSDTDTRGASQLRGLYGLSTAEAVVALALGQGRSPAEIAEERGVSLLTVRTQIKQLLRKAEARNLADLAAMVASTPAVRTEP